MKTIAKAYSISSGYMRVGSINAENASDIIQRLRPIDTPEPEIGVFVVKVKLLDEDGKAPSQRRTTKMTDHYYFILLYLTTKKL